MSRAPGALCLNSIVKLPVFLYLTDARIPELASFAPPMRRLLRQAAFKQMFTDRPLLRWLPYALCALGVVAALFTFRALPQFFYSLAGDPLRIFVPTAYMLAVAALGGFVGSPLLTHRARVYLRRLIDTNGHGTEPAT